MIFTAAYILLAILALSFLIFIHELGHYFMARRVGMRVETFAIGFGKPIYTWERDGVKWQINWLLFGGYVKIAGTDTEKDPDPYKVPDGFFGKSPLDRIKVAFMGPFVNIAFALLVFIVLWGIGGRTKNFSEFTAKIGWVDPKSELYVHGIRPGDEVRSYEGHPYQGIGDHLYAPMTASEEGLKIVGEKVNYATGEKHPFEEKVKPYPRPNVVQKGIMTSGILAPANYIIYDKFPGGRENPLLEGSPLQGSGIQYGDRIVWVDGNLIFSNEQLDKLLNDGKVLLTVKRGNEILQVRVPRVFANEFRLDPQAKEELIDWQFASGLNAVKFQNLHALPYNLTNDAVVEGEYRFIDKENEATAFPQLQYASTDQRLQKGDKILAVDGIPVTRSHQILAQVQQHKVNIIVQRNPSLRERLSWKGEDAAFDGLVEWKDLQTIAMSIGTGHPVEAVGDLVLLKPVLPKAITDFPISAEKQAQLEVEVKEQKKHIAAIEDPEKRAQATKNLENQTKRLILGFAPQDRKVEYNPLPTEQFENVFVQIWRTLMALFTGSLNPKWLSGPVGIVQVVYDSSLVSLKDSLFWIGAISLNLGVLNLLPIPVLDGGTILLSLFEMATGKKIQPKTLETLIIPFAILLIGMFLFFTYNDLSRLLF